MTNWATLTDYQTFDIDLHGCSFVVELDHPVLLWLVRRLISKIYKMSFKPCPKSAFFLKKYIGHSIFCSLRNSIFKVFFWFWRKWPPRHYYFFLSILMFYKKLLALLKSLISEKWYYEVFRIFFMFTTWLIWLSVLPFCKITL